MLIGYILHNIAQAHAVPVRAHGARFTVEDEIEVCELDDPVGIKQWMTGCTPGTLLALLECDPDRPELFAHIGVLGRAGELDAEIRMRYAVVGERVATSWP